MFSLELDAFDFSDSDDDIEANIYKINNGFNIIIIEKTNINNKDYFNILNPKRGNHYSKRKNTVFLLKQNEYFEPKYLILYQC